MDGPPTPGADLGETRPDLPPRVGRYRIEAKIGEGGMGAVYLGRGPDGRPVAVKVVRPGLAGDPAFLARFRDEARNAERVAAFCTAQVLEHGEDDGVAYLVTEYIEGPSLLGHVTDNGPLSPGMLHGVAVGVAAALVGIHAAGLVHRDLKPSNVLLSISGPRVIDFGIARALDAAASHTRTGQVIGSPGWIAPEQILGQRATPAVDVYAWGCLVAYAANGRNPYGQGSFQLMAARAVHAEPDLGVLTEPLASLVRGALAKDPAHRPSARDLLLSLTGGTGTEADVNTTIDESWRAPATLHEPATATPTAPATQREAAVAAPRELATVTRETQGHPVRRRSTRPFVLAGLAALVTAITAGGVVLLVGNGDDGASDTGAATPGALPKDPMLVRVDAQPGWPGTCHGDIGTYVPGAAAPTTLADGPRCDTLPVWSPDRRRIAFTRSGGGRTEAWVMNADGSDPRKVTDRISGGRVTWSPDGRRLAFMGRDNGVAQIFVITVGEATPTRLTDDPADKDDPAWSATGRLAFWSKRGGTEQIYTLDPRHPDQPWTRLTGDGVRAVDPAWSPDGRRIAYTRGAYPQADIWVANADGTGAHRVTTGAGHDMDPTWSRNGTWIAYVSGRYAEPRLRAVRSDGSGDQRIVPNATSLGHPDWS
ncbi:protein kinase domain-containing protein [Actinomadura miaoliensis]|uniref:Protein kinase domain-containing protein n=1 Tax=Actinomadura miaoliensis TaxID=430685 RepID=A0ABP7X3K3_9ACTN